MSRCTACLGQKQVYGMGNMREKCKSCNGKGFLKDSETSKPKPKENNQKGKSHDGKQV